MPGEKFLRQKLRRRKPFGQGASRQTAEAGQPLAHVKAEAPVLFQSGFAKGDVDFAHQRARAVVDAFGMGADGVQSREQGVHKRGGNIARFGLMRHAPRHCGSVRRRMEQGVVQFGLHFGMEGAFAENGPGRFLHQLVGAVGERPFGCGDGREQEQDAVVEGIAGNRPYRLRQYGKNGGGPGAGAERGRVRLRRPAGGARIGDERRRHDEGSFGCSGSALFRAFCV